MDQLEEIKNKINIVDLISEHIPLKKTGQNFKALCPFHSEKTPSFVVSPERQIWHCFGACNEGGDIFKFLMKVENIEFGEALKILAKRAGIKLVRYLPSGKEKKKQLYYEINHLAGEYYRFLLLNHPAGKKALDYILGRGISRTSLKLFGLGFAPNSWDSLQKFMVGKKGYRAEDLEKAGLVIKRTGGFYDRFRDRLVFPLKDHRGNVCGFSGRILEQKNAGGKYINTPETEIYHKSDLLYGLAENKEAIKKADQAILVEGELDVISSCQAGVNNVVAIKGSALTPSQVRLLSRFTKNIVLALDCDLAGDQAVRRGIEMADSAEMSIGVVRMREGKDPDEVAQKNPQLWQKLVGKPVPVYDYSIDSTFTRFNAKTSEGKRRIGQELIPILAGISSEIVQAYYIGRLAQKLEVPEEAVAVEVEKVRTRGGSTLFQADEAGLIGEGKSRREMLEEHFLALCFQSGNWKLLLRRKFVALIETPRFKHILDVLAKYLKRCKILDSQRLAKMLPEELRQSFDRFYLLTLNDLIGEQDKLDRELGKVTAQLEELKTREKLRTISREIEALEAKRVVIDRDQKQLNRLHRQFRDFSSRLSGFGEKK